MTASPLTVSNYPLFLNGRTLSYTAAELRRSWDDSEIGPGVLDQDSFRVRQRVAGLNQSVDVVAASVLNRAYVRSSIALSDSIGATSDGGLYRVDYNSATILNLDVTAADATNPRIDQVYLAVEDQQVVGSNNTASIRLVTGTPTGGATLDNRTGVGAAPASMASILLADILVPALSVNVPTANIRDRRPITGPGTVPWLGSTGTQTDQVAFVPLPGLSVQAHMRVFNGSGDNTQIAGAMYLPRRIVGATRLRWRYNQDGTAAASNYVWGIFDASGRQITGTAATAFTGALNTIQQRSETLLATTTFEAGVYYVMFGVAVMGAGAGMIAQNAVSGYITVGNNDSGPSAPNLLLRLAGGGSVLPTTILGFSDYAGLSAAITSVPLPVPTLSVT